MNGLAWWKEPRFAAVSRDAIREDDNDEEGSEGEFIPPSEAACQAA
jgi:hypothetical protein